MTRGAHVWLLFRHHELHHGIKTGSKSHHGAKLMELLTGAQHRLSVWCQALTQRLVGGLKEFRAIAAPNFRANHRLILPPTLHLLPLWILGARR